MNIVQGIRAFTAAVRQSSSSRKNSGRGRFDDGFAHGFGELAGGASGWAQSAFGASASWAQPAFGEYYPRSAIVYSAIKVRQDAIARLPLRVLRRVCQRQLGSLPFSPS